MATPSSTNVKFGRGRLLFNRLDDNLAFTGLVNLGNCEKISITSTPEDITLTDYTQETSAPYAEVNKSLALDLAITGFEFDPSVMETVWMGTRDLLSQTSSNVTDETLAASTITNLKEKSFQTTKRNISAVTITQGATTLVLGTDYEIYDATLGIIRILPTSSTVADGTALLIDYTAGAVSGLHRIKGATKANIKGKLIFLPANSTGPKEELHVWHCSLKPDGEIDFISDEFARWNLSGKILSDAAGAYGGSAGSPYFETVKR
jgi:hypothetical protein